MHHAVSLAYFTLKHATVGASLVAAASRPDSALAREHNGDECSCDHFVYPQYKLGNLMMNESLGAMVKSPAQKAFGLRRLVRSALLLCTEDWIEG